MTVLTDEPAQTPVVIDEDLDCPRCGYNLRGLPQPRCPECGLVVDLDQIRAAQALLSKPLFEYQWRRRPIRSFFSTVWLTVRPWRLWRTVKLEWEPQNKTIWIYGFFALLLMPMIGMVCVKLCFLIDYAILFPIIKWNTPVSEIALALPDKLFAATRQIPAGLLSCVQMTLPLSVIIVTTYAGCRFYRHSILHYRIKTGHLVRIAVYSSGVYWLGALSWGGWCLLLLSESFLGSKAILRIESSLEIADQVLPLIIVLSWAASLVLGAKWYLRVPRAWLMILSAGIFGLTATIFIFFFIIQLFGENGYVALVEWMQMNGMSRLADWLLH